MPRPSKLMELVVETGEPGLSGEEESEFIGLLYPFGGLPDSTFSNPYFFYAR